MFTVFPRVYVTIFCFKQLPSDFTLVLVSIKARGGARQSLNVVEGLIISSDNPLGFYDEICSVFPTFLKYLYID